MTTQIISDLKNRSSLQMTNSQIVPTDTKGYQITLTGPCHWLKWYMHMVIRHTMLLWRTDAIFKPQKYVIATHYIELEKNMNCIAQHLNNIDDIFENIWIQQEKL